MMRYRWGVIATLTGGLIGAGLLGFAGPAAADIAHTELTDDGYGVLLGSDDAPVRLEIFCEPQCPYCAKLEAASGDQITREVAGGRLAVTYRWLTFLDAKRHNDTSARVADALMVAADPATVPVAYQNFVGDVYRNQNRYENGPTTDDIATMARESGVPGPVADRIADGESTDIAAMNTANRARLNRANPENPGTPTVYDRNTNTVVDTDDPGWLDRLMQAD